MVDSEECNQMNGRDCNKCKIWKDETHFSKEKRALNGLYSICHECKQIYREENSKQIKEWHAQNYINNKKEIDIENRNWRVNNREIVNLIQRIYRKNNPEKTRERKLRNYHKKKNDPVYNLKIRLRNRLRGALDNQGFKKNKIFAQVIGCSYEQLKFYIESQFKNGMTWENRNLWELDHIIALGLANTEEEVYKLSHYTNIQPLWIEDHKIKTINDKILIRNKVTCGQ